jgi:hypothetical protein
MSGLWRDPPEELNKTNIGSSTAKKAGFTLRVA